ncbi:flagellar hook protein FlgE [Crenobacter luteus]|uniref:Flagellar hook protein FlgE n=1 Tax=Crenobacter luteus TaxID=1452487 RepID=A0A165G6P6_9NEIS|nr:flagellar hook protein FlgE [Crenobacter luteus]KZE35265.1 flagellar biosynthesis protein FlgE [Crenobacter luteus]TCP13823.1 flagellar hook protein FlgE [Crenobacter luteus]
MGFQQGLSGLSAASKQLDVIGNNVANANTVGFKGSRAEFSDIYAASIYGVAATQSGIGAKTVNVTQQFTQGNITTTSNPLDLAIAGNGFFRVDRAGDVAYMRNGQFQLDRDGYFVNNGFRLTGYQADTDGNIIAGPPVDLKVNAANIGAEPTTSLLFGANLDAKQTAPAVAFPGADPANPDPNSVNHSRSVTLYDSLGVSHLLTLYYVKSATDPLQWDVYTRFDTDPIAVPATPLTTLTFNNNGTFNSASGATVPGTVTFNAPALTNGAAPLVVNVDLSKTTQFAGPFSVNTLTADGYADGTLTGLATTPEGVVEARFSNGQTKVIGQVVLTSFANVQGLKPSGDNRWVESFESGRPKVNTPGSSNVGLIQSAALEDSNVDLTSELVNMITAQRFYQANAQTIKTQDAILQTLINLR